MTWHNAPPEWNIDESGRLTATSGSKTDFWQITHYGFQRDDGHALMAPRTGDFSATLRFTGDYQTLYDQAGLLLRVGPSEWVKFGIELTDGAPHLSVVVTDGRSDWSAQRVSLNGPTTLRATRLGNALLLQHLEAETWQMARLAPVPGAAPSLSVGPYLCSPERSGFEAQFLGFELTNPKVTSLHA